MKKNIINDLKKRKLIKQISNKKKLINKINNKKINIYCGFDPTNYSLHIGHLLLLITLKRFQKENYKIIILIGEITSIIGDPSFKKKKRKIINNKKIKIYTKNIKKQINKILNYKKKNKIKIITNKKWFNNMKMIYFLKNIGKYFKINKLLNKDSIKIRNKNNKNGITFKEISYNLLQSYDYYWLFKKFNINLQIGGSDQWGNITSGIDLIKKKYKKKVFGLTLPLITNKNGKKFGKSKKNNNIWLNKYKTTPYEFYQFWLNIEDKKIYLYFKQFTLIKINKIKKIIKKNNIINNKKLLAKYITKLIHGKNETKKAIFVTNFYFKLLNNINNITIKLLNKLYKINIPKIILKNNKNINIKKILLLFKIVKSTSKAHNLILNKSININKKLIKNTNYFIKEKDKYFNKYTIISKGKKKFYLIYWK